MVLCAALERFNLLRIQTVEDFKLAQRNAFVRHMGMTSQRVRDRLVERLREKGALAMHWSANGWHYGVRREHLKPLSDGGWVLVSGSRAHWPTVQSLYPGLTGVHVHASAAVLRQRLLALAGRAAAGGASLRSLTASVLLT